MERPRLTADEEAFLAATPWCGHKYRSAGVVPFTPANRQTTPVHSPVQMEERLLSRVLRRADAVPICLAYHEPENLKAALDEEKEASSSSSSSSTATGGGGGGGGNMMLIPSATMMYSLGPGVRGFNGFTHGGMLAVLIDESVGNYLLVNQYAMRRLASQQQKQQQQQEHDARPVMNGRLVDLVSSAAFTVGMNIRFLKLIDTPRAVIATSSLDRVEGRKIMVKTVVEGEGGVRFATCESTWVLVPQRSSKM